MFEGTSIAKKYEGVYNLFTINLHNPRANGAKRRSGRKPGARVTNFAPWLACEAVALVVVHGRR